MDCKAKKYLHIYDWNYWWGYTVVTAATTSTFHYELIDALAESQDYIIFLMKKRYAQPLDKRTLTGGTVEEFKRFLEEKTGKTFRRVK